HRKGMVAGGARGHAEIVAGPYEARVFAQSHLGFPVPRLAGVPEREAERIQVTIIIGRDMVPATVVDLAGPGDDHAEMTHTGAGHQQTPAGRGRLAGVAPLADGRRVLRACPAWRPAAAEDRAGGHGTLSGPCDVGDAEARDPLGGEGPGQLTPSRRGPRCVF